TDLTFEQWVVHMFDQPVPRKKWYLYDRGDADEAFLEPTTVLEYTTRLFRDCGSLLEPYSDAQLNQALWHLGGATGDLYCLADRSLPLDDRLACVASMTFVYEQCFLPRCTDHLGHRSEKGNVPLNSICYMWWDIFPLYGQPKDEHRHEIDEACLTVMDLALGLSSVACQESALHGLGHWQRSYPERCGQIVRSFIKSNQAARADLLKYAEQASKGMVL
ncbi:MAG: hypothetical protein IH945_13855, partial [Armatimonadetes bacterium]|nr:hypothetical protein [Armatimonadota bacterium]